MPFSREKGVHNPKAYTLHAASLHQTFVHCAIFPTAASRRSLGRISVPVRPTTLSGRLPVKALVSHHPTNKLIDREPTLHRKNLSHPPHARQTEHKVLNTLSGAYPKEKDRLLTCYSPVRHSHQKRKRSWIPFDLHVLSTPPAFILSQDQTLQQKPKTSVQARKQSSKNKHQQSKNKTFQNHQHQKNKKQKKPKHPTKQPGTPVNPTQTKQKNTLSRTQTTKPQTNQKRSVKVIARKTRESQSSRFGF